MNILFASMPFDGHFNPLTGPAAYLRDQGHDVRFYTGPTYEDRLARLDIPHFPFVRALGVNTENLLEYFPEYEKFGTGPKAIAFALTKIFFGNTEAHYHDIEEIQSSFSFDAFVCDSGFFAGYLVAEKLKVPVHAIGPSPTPSPTSKSMPPPFFGLRPATNGFTRVKHRVINKMVETTNRSGMKLFNDLLEREGLPPYGGSAFDIMSSSATSYLQSGAPGLDYDRTDWPTNHRFVGAVLPAPSTRAAHDLTFRDKAAKFGSLIAVSQGTMDNRDPEKLFVPALEALAGGEHLVVVCTGGRNTENLRQRFPQDNVVVEDWIDFNVLLKMADLFICNGGYGSILLALTNGVPILSAGKLEGKNDINARLEFRGLGLDLRTERPTAAQIANGVTRVLGDDRYIERVRAVQDELNSYSTLELIEQAVVGAVR